MLKIWFGRGFVICDGIYCLDNPNGFGGIGDIEVKCARLHCNLWTGDAHLVGDRFRFHFGNVTKIEEHLDFETNSDGAPVTLWEYESPFTYEKFIVAAKIVRSKVDNVKN